MIIEDVFDKEHIQKMKDALEECEERFVIACAIIFVSLSASSEIKRKLRVSQDSAYTSRFLQQIDCVETQYFA